MIAYLTQNQTEYTKLLASQLEKKGYTVYSQEELDSITSPIDLFIATENERAQNDDFSIFDGIDPDAVMDAVHKNVSLPLKRLEAALPRMDGASPKTVCFFSSHLCSVNMNGQTEGYGFCMSKAALHQALTIMKNRLSRDGYSFRVFDPLLDGDRRVTPQNSAAAAARYILTQRAYDPDNRPGRDDETRLVLRDALGREWPW